MGSFFAELARRRQLNKWAETLDWLFDDNRFLDEKGWESNKVGLFTKRMKKIKAFSKENYMCVDKADLSYPNTEPQYSAKGFKVVMKGKGQARSMVRHIRNSIAHGNSKFLSINKVPYIELLDFDKEEGKKQTAYICIPLSFILDLHKIYKDIEAEIVNATSAVTVSVSKAETELSKTCEKKTA